MLNKLKKIAVVITAMVTMGCVGYMPTSYNVAAETLLTDLEIYRNGDWCYSVFSDGTVVIRQYNGDGEIITVPAEINGRTVSEIGDHAFAVRLYPKRETKEFILPETIRKIGSGAFGQYEKLEKINIPDNVKEIGARAFNDCSSLKSINLNKVEKLGFGVFEGCSALEQIIVPGTIKTIPEWAFYKCTGLKSLIINSGVTAIEEEAALNTPALERIVIPDSVTSIGEYAFCYSCEFHEVNEGSYVGYYQYTLNADNLKEYNFVPGSAAEQYGIDPAIVMAVIWKESRNNRGSGGDGGESLGLMQIQPKWHQWRMNCLNCPDLFDPFQNVTVGCHILGEKFQKYGNIEMALMAYNAGDTGANRNWFSKGVYTNKYSQAVLQKAEELKVRE